MSDAPKGFAPSSLLHMPAAERRNRLRLSASASPAGAGIRAEIRSLTSKGSAQNGVEPFAAHWQDRLIERVCAAETAIDAERQAAADLLPKLLEQPAARRQTLVRNSRKFHTWSVCQLIKEAVSYTHLTLPTILRV